MFRYVIESIVEWRNVILCTALLAAWWAVAVSHHEDKNFSAVATQIHNGMAMPDVLRIAGEPHQRSHAGNHTLLSWRTSTSNLSIGLRDGVVYGVVVLPQRE